MSLSDGAPAHLPPDIMSHAPHSGGGAKACEKEHGCRTSDPTLMWEMPLNRSGRALARGERTAIVCCCCGGGGGAGAERLMWSIGRRNDVLCCGIKGVSGSLKVKKGLGAAEILLESPVERG